MRCNWYWGSHGCDLTMGHEGHHRCGSEDDPCSMHDGTRVLFHYVDADWSDEWLDSSGFCLGDGTERVFGGGVYPPCPEPEACVNRETAGHAWSRDKEGASE